MITLLIINKVKELPVFLTPKFTRKRRKRKINDGDMLDFIER